jgi:3D (Asp-Asp-Asp) domain-containing protein
VQELSVQTDRLDTWLSVSVGAICGAVIALSLLFLPDAASASGPCVWQGEAWVTGYNRLDPAMNAHTADGTPITTPEPIAAASYDVRMGALVEIDGLGTFRVADRGSGLGNGSPLTHIDVAVWSNEAAYEITGIKWVCFRRGDY